MNFFFETVISYQCVELYTRLPSSQAVISASSRSPGFSSLTTVELVCGDVSLLAYICLQSIVLNSLFRMEATTQSDPLP